MHSTSEKFLRKRKFVIIYDKIYSKCLKIFCGRVVEISDCFAHRSFVLLNCNRPLFALNCYSNDMCLMYTIGFAKSRFVDETETMSKLRNLHEK